MLDRARSYIEQELPGSSIQRVLKSLFEKEQASFSLMSWKMLDTAGKSQSLMLLKLLLEISEIGETFEVVQ